METGLGEARGEPAERKLVTVLFCDLVGSTALGERLDPEAFQAVLGAYFDRMRRLSEGFGGVVEKFIGDAVVSVFGIPSVHEDDAERAVRCALSMRDALAGLNDTLRPRFGVELVCRIGINTGVALASAEALATGDVMNTAARLEQAAEPGEILAGRETMLLTRDGVTYGEPRPIDVKGKAEPLQGWSALALASRRTRPRAPFIGRAPELESLTAAVERSIRESTTQVGVVLGEPGIGKTRILDEFAARTTGRAAVFRGACVPYGESTAWTPFVEVVKTESQILEFDGADIALRKLRKRLEVRHDAAEVAVIETQIGPLLGALRSTVPSGPELLWAIRRYLEALARDGNVVLVFDNLQWAAQTLIETICELAETIEGVPLAMLCVGRPELRERLAGLLGREQTVLVTLGALSPDHSRELVANLRAQSGSVLSPPVEESIAARGQGNPLFLEEIAAMAAEEGGAGGIPHSLQALISARLDLLPSEAKRVAQCAAAIGDVFWDGAVWRVESRQNAEASVGTALRMLRTRGFVEEEPASAFLGTRQFRFHHALLREVAYGSVPLRDRYFMHRAAAEWLDERAGDRAEFFPKIAYHFDRALALAGVVSPLDRLDDVLVEAALASFVRAGHQATAQVAHEEAARWYERALEALDLTDDDPALRCSIILSLGDVRQRAGDTPRAREAFAGAAALAREHGMTEHLARAALGVGGGQTFDIDAFTVDQDLVTLLEEALAELGLEESGLRARLLGRLAVALYFSPDESRKSDLSREAVEMARRVGDRASLAYTLSARRFAVWAPENVDERLEVATEILQLAEDAGDRELALLGHRWRIVGLLELGDIAAVEDQVGRYAELAVELHQPYQLWFSAIFRAMQAALEGRLSEAEALAQQALETGGKVGGEQAVQFWASQLMTIRANQGRLGELAPAIKVYGEQFPEIPAVRASMAYVASHMGSVDEAREALERAAAHDFADLTHDTTWLLTLSMLTEAVAFLGDVDRARTLYEMLLPYAGRTVVIGPAVACLGSTARYLGVLATIIGDYDAADRHFTEAIEMNERMGAQPYLAHSLMECATMLLRRNGNGDEKRALEYLDRAERIYRALGMDSFMDRSETLRRSPEADPAL